MKRPFAFARTSVLLSCLAGTAAWAAEPAPPPLAPRPETGFSSIEQRWVYAPPDEGTLHFQMVANALPGEHAVETESICDNPVDVTIKYSKSKNTVQIKARFKGLPYRMSATRDSDVSNQWNQHLVSVENGHWQLWFIGKLFTQDVLFYYDGLTTELLGSEWDFPDGPPANAIPVVIPAALLMGSPEFEGPPDGNFTFTWNFAYDRMLDSEGQAGTYDAFVPERLCAPDKFLNFYVQGGIPADHASSFDEVLESIHSGNGIFTAITLEPFPKPDFLKSRSNIMTAYQGGFPQEIPEGYHLDFRGQTLQLRMRGQCGVSHTMPPFPGPYYDFCG